MAVMALMTEGFNRAAVVDLERIVNETAVRDVYVCGAWDMLVLCRTDLTYNGRIAVICEWVGRSDGTVRGIVDGYRKRKELLDDVERNQLELGSDAEERGG